MIKQLKLLIIVVMGIYSLSLQASTKKPIQILQQATKVPLTLIMHEWPNAIKCVENRTINIECVNKQLANKNNNHWAIALKARWLQLNNQNAQSLLLIEKAIQIDNDQHLFYFQQAVSAYQNLKQAQSGAEKWQWSMKTAKAYEKAFKLNSNIFQYRYYLIYHFMQLPKQMGGNKQKSLKLANDAINSGKVLFYPVRGDVYYSIGNNQLALQDYLAAVSNKVYKIESFEKALRIETLTDKQKLQLHNFQIMAQKQL